MKKTILSILVLYVSLFLSSCSKNGASNNNKSFEVSESMDCRVSPPRITIFQTGELAIRFVDNNSNYIDYTPKLDKWYSSKINPKTKYKIRKLERVEFGFYLMVSNLEYSDCQ